MNKLVATTAAIAFALLLTGCGAAQQSGELNGVAKFAASADETEATSEPTPTETVEPAVDVTAAGEVCDPHNFNDLICAAFYPEQVVLNVTSAERAKEPLASMTDEQKIQLAHDACTAFAAGGTKDTVTLVETSNPEAVELAGWNNSLVFSAGALGYCNDYIEGENFQWGVNEYRSMGEQAAKESFADGVPITATR